MTPPTIHSVFYVSRPLIECQSFALPYYNIIYMDRKHVLLPQVRSPRLRFPDRSAEKGFLTPAATARLRRRRSARLRTQADDRSGSL